MKKLASLMLATAVLAGCAQSGDKGSVTAQDLQHHRYVLQSVDGKPLEGIKRMPELSFGENMHISGSMCNRFMGQATLEDSTLKAKGLGMTMMLCVEPQLNQLDRMINDMLTGGAQVGLAQQQLTLKNSQHTLVYKLADLVN
ncbi:heat shock protein HslJ [Enterobacteriaceae bacterium H20N1]|uniref:Heat shock protein HslJ n=1 Tax=Dryocola boscaweniae TaxID=2925397 RepID=A0A9X3APT6_9ENTR|nr:heat shock protein HslJ [Dryocola boscaweniae]MCT4703926.1 heat shock protein HslJ [Dryocola boscaweniae]MCT4717106.1 heat shock protein HslJ [Dryocola boscaweniae]MCT4721094.1 heat shock protein HslJ [Dryocola boscaweniae]